VPIDSNRFRPANRFSHHCFKLCMVLCQALVVVRHKGRKIEMDKSSERGACQSTSVAHRCSAAGQTSPAVSTDTYLGCSLNSFAVYNNLTIDKFAIMSVDAGQFGCCNTRVLFHRIMLQLCVTVLIVSISMMTYYVLSEKLYSAYLLA